VARRRRIRHRAAADNSRSDNSSSRPAAADLRRHCSAGSCTNDRTDRRPAATTNHATDDRTGRAADDGAAERVLRGCGFERRTYCKRKQPREHKFR
jgi:hypothetical protein